MDPADDGIPPESSHLQPQSSYLQPPATSGSGSVSDAKQSSSGRVRRMESLKRSLSTGVKRSQSAVAHFLGVDRIPEASQDERQAMWEARRVTLGRRFGAKPKIPITPLEEGMDMDRFDAAAPPHPLVTKTLQALRKPSVAELAWRRVSKAAVAAKTEGRERPAGPRRMESFAPTVPEERPEVLDVTIRNERFFDDIGEEDKPVKPPPVPPALAMAVGAFQSVRRSSAADERRRLYQLTRSKPLPVGHAPLALAEDTTDLVHPAAFVQKALEPQKKSRYFGMGFLNRLCPGSSKFRKDLEAKVVEEQLMELFDHRPYFTYWVTVVQTLILVVSLAVYGFAPVGFDNRQQSSLILETSLALETVDYLEPENFWLGPRAAHLIHLGAKYAPCMRPDDQIGQKIAAERAVENKTACCIRNDGSGCVQSPQSKCSKTMATFNKWPHVDWDVRTSGSVCGQDPRYCSDPASTGAHEWPDDITKWPMCKKKSNTSSSRHRHMSCEVVGHPCCTGIQGECQITTREYCDFVQGYFHEDALLCSQVSCLDKICGMLPFFDPEVPDQFYRLWTAIFLHAGVIHLVVTICFQYFIMRDTEKLIGYLRMAIIYIMSGVVGNLASSIFTPYVAEVGPAGSQFGVFGCLVVECFYTWRLVERPWLPLVRYMGIAFFLFILGLFPWTDNYSHIFGFIFGILLSLALLPYIAFNERDRRFKVSIIIVSLLVAAGLFAGLIILFYIHPIYGCEACTYLNCIPITENFCDNQKITIVKKVE